MYNANLNIDFNIKKNKDNLFIKIKKLLNKIIYKLKHICN